MSLEFPVPPDPAARTTGPLGVGVGVLRRCPNTESGGATLRMYG